MARLKKGKKKKVPISFRLESETIDRLKRIDKFHSKIDVIVNKGLDDYDGWLETYFIDTGLTECNDFLDVFIDDDLRYDYIKSLKNLNDYYESEPFLNFIQRFMNFKNQRMIKFLNY